MIRALSPLPVTGAHDKEATDAQAVAHVVQLPSPLRDGVEALDRGALDRDAQAYRAGTLTCPEGTAPVTTTEGQTVVVTCKDTTPPPITDL
jgi:hypothetical protein